MKQIIAILIFFFIAFQSVCAQKNKIRVEGNAGVAEKQKFGSGGSITVVKGAEWLDSVTTVKIKADGSFRFSLPDSLIVYQLFISKPGFVTKHVQVYPELGSYHFNIVLKPLNSSVSFAADTVTWIGAHAEAQRAAYKAFNNISDFEKSMVNFLTAFKSGVEGTKFEGFDLQPQLSNIEAQINKTADPELRKILLIEYLCIDAVQQKVQIRRKSGQDNQLFKGKASTIILEQLLKEVPPESALWNLENNAIRWLVKQVPLTADALTYYEALIQKQATSTLAASVLYGLAQRYREENRQDDFAVALTRLVTDYPGLHPTNKAKAEFTIFSNLTVGKPVPDFSSASVDKPSELVTQSGMLGKMYLIEFWTLWCKGCLQAIPELEKLYIKYHKQGFEIVSIYLDKRLEPLKKFREINYPMQWINTFEPGAFKSELAKNFEISWIPRSVLVGADGMILAVNPDMDKIIQLIELHLRR